nr:uncharacterized transmembrane protein DDB_G0289901-like [Aegilops tauschii subsp. strangulata]
MEGAGGGHGLDEELARAVPSGGSGGGGASRGTAVGGGGGRRPRWSEAGRQREAGQGRPAGGSTGGAAGEATATRATAGASDPVRRPRFRGSRVVSAVAAVEQEAAGARAGGRRRCERQGAWGAREGEQVEAGACTVVAWGAQQASEDGACVGGRRGAHCAARGVERAREERTGPHRRGRRVKGSGCRGGAWGRRVWCRRWRMTSASGRSGAASATTVAGARRGVGEVTRRSGGELAPVRRWWDEAATVGADGVEGGANGGERRGAAPIWIGEIIKYYQPPSRLLQLMASGRESQVAGKARNKTMRKKSYMQMPSPRLVSRAHSPPSPLPPITSCSATYSYRSLR